MMLQKSLKITVLLSLVTLLYNCSKTEIVPQDVEIHDFTWRSMNAFYKNQASIEDLSDQRFSSRTELNEYLKGFETPGDLFTNLLSTTDKTSTITDNYTDIYLGLDGYNETTGIEFSIIGYQDKSENVYGYVSSVVPNSDAEAKGIKVGTIFNQIDGEDLTTSNYRSLLNSKEYTITIADYNLGNPSVTSNTVSLTETTIPKNTVISSAIITEDSKKIGYIALDKFVPKFDTRINSIFQDFSNQKIDHLIVDLRNSYGGAIETSTYIASMITGQFEGELFTKQIWNEKVLNEVVESQRNSYFTTVIDNGFTEKENINSLNLNSVYFLTSERTSGAAEVLINSLQPFIDVKVIGETTKGDFLCSTLLYDSDNYRFDGDNLNTTHNWATFPLVFEAKNKENTNTPSGITPNISFTQEPNNDIIQNTINYIVYGTKPVKSTNVVLWNSYSEVTNTDIDKMYIGYRKIQ